MSDNESESSCLSALEDATLGGTTPVERNSTTPESEENIYLETRSNLSDDDQSQQPTISKSTTASYQDCMSLDDVSSEETSRTSTPITWKSLVDPNDPFFAKKDDVAQHQDDVESLKSEEIKEESIVKDPLTEQESADESPNKKQQEDESSTELQEEDEPVHKSEEIIAEQKSADESPTKKQKKDEPIDPQTLKKYTGAVDPPAKVQQEDDPVVTKHQDVVESPKSEERIAEKRSADESPTKKQKKDEPIDKERLEKYTDHVESPAKVQQEDDSVVAKHQDVVESPKSEERIAEKRSADESPTKKQKKDEPIDKERLEKYTDHVESPAKVQQEDDSVVAKHQDVVESPKSEERIAEKRSADESPTKKQKKDELIDQQTFEKYTGAIESPTKEQEDDSVVAKHQDVVESPKSEERIAEKRSVDESPTKKQKKDELIDQQTLEKYTGAIESPTKEQEDDSVVAKHQDVVESPKSAERIPEQRSADESPTKKQKKDEPIDKETLEKYTGAVKSSAKVQQEDDPDVAKQQEVVESRKSEERFAKQENADESPTKKQKKDEMIDKEILEENTVDVESSEKAVKHKSDVESPTKVHQEDDPKNQLVVESLQRKETKKESIVKEKLAESKNDVESPIKKQKDEPIDKETLEECKGNVESPKRDKIEDGSTVKEKLAEQESVVESPTKEQNIAEEVESLEDKEIPDQPIDEETGEERKDVDVLPKPEEEIKYESMVQEESTKHGGNVELPIKEQKKDELVVADDHESDNPVKDKTDVLTDETKSSEHGSDKPVLSGETPSPPGLDKDFFEYIFKGFYKTDLIQIYECEVGDESSIQPSFMCQVKKFTLIGRHDNTRFEYDVIVKQLHSKDHQDLYKSDIAAKNEAIAYNTIFPSLKNQGISLPVPMCFYANDEQIVVEDLCGLGYKAFEKKTGFMTIKECGNTLKALAEFHAASLVLKYKNNDEFQKIKNLTKNPLYNNDAKKSSLLEHQEASLRGILSVHTSMEQSEKNETNIKALEYLIKVAKNDIKDLVCKKQDDYALCHGDLLLTNILFKLNDDKQKKTEKSEIDAEMDIKFIDFQNVQYCSVASDLVYLLFVNLKPEDYIDKKDDLLLMYFYYLNKNVIDCGVGDNFTLTYDWLENEMDRFAEYGIIYALWILPLFDNSDDDNKDQSKEVTQEMLNSKKIFYNKRMRKWVDYYSTIYEKKFGI